ncbi:peptidase S1 [Micromonospora sp. CB01531]|nr:trypsin-like peptidase domain-containing protein [Micromonospora sp. CB01531]OKI65959.1 peptidase S1 [Micromonospora sp. CB01531]
MTAAHGGAEVPGPGSDETADQARGETVRPGPLPPRMIPPVAPGQPAPFGAPAGFPAAPTGGVPAPEQPAGAPGQPAVPAPRATWPAVPNSGQWGPAGGSTAPRPQDGWPPAPPGSAPGQPVGAEPTVGFAAQPITAPAPPASAPAPPASVPLQPVPGPAFAGQPAPAPTHPGQPISTPAHPAQPTTAPVHPTSAPAHPGQPVAAPTYPGQPISGPAYPGQPIAGPALPGQSAPGPAYPGGAAGGTGRGRRLPVVALVLAGVLAVVAGVQAYQIHRLDDRLAATDRRLADAQGADGSRLDGLEKRAEGLEKQAGSAFNPEAVASAVLPSVFRVSAGQFTGTAFAIGKPPSGGGTMLLTNFHVVESVYDGGGRKVFLERTGQRFEATIVKVDKDKDLAQLRTTARFTGLVAAGTPVKSGQQIVVVGAPLGLQDSVTTGVVSAFRPDEGGSGPVIQFDAPINPGNSGGPVINGAKEVVGIATAKARDAEGIGLAVPIKTACDTFTLC